MTTSISGEASTSSAGAGLAWLSTTETMLPMTRASTRSSCADQARVEPDLPPERFGKPGVADVDPDDAPAVEALAEQVVGVFGLVAAVECADADMGHAGLQRRAVVGGLLHGLRKTAEQ